MGTRGFLVNEAAVALAAAGFTDARRQARRVVSEALSITQSDVFCHPDQEITEQQAERVRSFLIRMVAGEPLSRIIAKREFWGLEFTLSADTLDPRPETETLVEAVLRRMPDRDAPLHLLDLGTGTGCILLALLYELRAADGVGVDIAERAARMAARNALSLGLADRACFIVGNWADAVSSSFDFILANPPYVTSPAIAQLPREVADHDPLWALDGGEDGLQSHREIIGAASSLLSRDGIMVTEVGACQADAVATLIKTNGLIVDAVEKDLAGIDRCVVARLPPQDCRRQKKVGMRLGPV
jgi:release factor glutamine methyltransferase